MIDGKWQSRQRVEQMESIFNSQIQLVSALQTILEQVETSQPAYLELLDYYQSSTFLEDMDLADRGKFKNLPCGVLSEDGVYNLLIDRKELAAKLRECVDLLDVYDWREMVNRIEKVLELYKKAVLEKDLDLMLSLYCDDVLIYDVVGQWSLSGKKDLADMVTSWFQEIATDRVEVSYSNMEIQSSQTCAFAYFDASFSKIGKEQSVTDRFTMGFIYDQGWKIKHQHASHPLMTMH